MARKLVGSNDDALDLVRTTHGHAFGPMPLWYTHDMFEFARKKVGSNQEALDLIFEWYGLVEVDGDAFMIWWQLPSFEELAKDIPNFFEYIRTKVGDNATALDMTARVIKIAGRLTLDDMKSVFDEKRSDCGNNADALEATFVELESRDPVSQ